MERFVNDRFMTWAILLNLAILVLVVVGVLLWLINTYIPMQGAIKTILNVVVVVAILVWVLQAVGLWGTVSNYKVTR